MEVTPLTKREITFLEEMTYQAFKAAVVEVCIRRGYDDKTIHAMQRIKIIEMGCQAMKDYFTK